MLIKHTIVTMLLQGLCVVCIQAIFLKAVLSQCIGSPLLAPESVFLPNMAGGLPTAPYSRIIGANLIVDTSAAEPSGVSIFSDNLIIEGTVLVTGNLPFLSTIALEGIVPGMGNSVVSYECSNGNVGMASNVVPPANVPSNTLGLGLAGDINRFR